MPIIKGAPLRALSAIVFIWISVRIIWESAIPSAVFLPVIVAESEKTPAHKKSANIDAAVSLAPLQVLKDPYVNLAASPRSDGDSMQSGAFGWESQRAPRPSKEGAKNLMPFANISAPPMPVTANSGTPAAPPRRIPQARQAASPSPSSKPLSGYFWVFARQSSGSGPAMPTPQSPGGQYGGSQAGAILTYRMTGTQKRGLSAYVRASSAIATAGEEEIAVGLRARPFAGIPLSLFAEQRMGAGQLHSRGTAVYVAGGTGADILMTGTRLEAYGQAGFIFTDNNSYFFDASATLQRKLWEQGHYKLTAGAGIWAGGQEGLTRIDIGPRANIHVPLGTRDVRFSLDWRQRVGGNAVPDSGVAVTVTTGF